MLKPYAYVQEDNEQKALAELMPMKPRTQEPCLDCTQPGRNTEGRYACTRPKGHTGLHAAHWREDRVCAVWDGSPYTGRT
jgi:hypothetical protein